MTINLDTLRKIAEAATPGPWEIDNLDRVVRTPDRGIVHDDSCADSEEWLANTDAPFIATFDPPTVLALLNRLEQAEAQIARVREVIHEYDPDCLTCMCNSDGDCCKCTVADFQEALDDDTRG